MPEEPFDWDQFHKVKWWWVKWVVLRWKNRIPKRTHTPEVPWWFFPMVVILRPFYWLKDHICKKRGKK